MTNIQKEKTILLEVKNQIPAEKQELPKAPTEIEAPKSHITTFVSSERQNVKTKSVQKIVSKRQYLTDGTPIPYEGERIFVIYESKD